MRYCYDEDQDQDGEDQGASSQEYDFAHYIGLQQVVAPHKPPSQDIKGEGGTSHRFGQYPHGIFNATVEVVSCRDTIGVTVRPKMRARRLLHFAAKLLHALGF